MQSLGREILDVERSKYKIRLDKTLDLVKVPVPGVYNWKRVRKSYFSSTSTSISSTNVPELDFFDEPVTYFPNENGDTGLSSSSNITSPSQNDTSTTDSTLAFDTLLVQLVSRGQASSDGGDEFGIPIKAAHSTAIIWADLIRHVSYWCRYEHENGNSVNVNVKEKGKKNLICDAPMLAAAAFAPLLIAGGRAYVGNLDDNYINARGSVEQNKNITRGPSFLEIIDAAAARKNEEGLSIREQCHLWALEYLSHNQHSKALATYCQLLETCPGDALALSLALDLSNIVGDKQSIFRATTSVASYWNERGQRGSPIGQASIEGHSIGSALIATGLAIGGRTAEAEQLSDKSLFLDRSGASGIVTWAKAHIYDAEGRVSEGSSSFTGDGVEHYEGCGFLFFDAKMTGIGSRFVMDRSGASADRKATRLYDSSFGRILDETGFDGSQEGFITRRIPGSKRDIILSSAGDAASSMFGNWFGSGSSKTAEKTSGDENVDKDSDDQYSNADIGASEPRSIEDVFTWLPPTVDVLTDASFLMLRLAISGVVEADDVRWKKLQSAWEKTVSIENNYADSESKLFSYSPMAKIASSLFIDFDHDSSGKSGKLQAAASLIGKLIAKKTEGEVKDQWHDVVKLLDEARSGWEKDEPSGSMFCQPSRCLTQDIDGWEITMGNFIEQALCYAAIQSQDYTSLCKARTLCSESVTLRANSPECWFRYGMILKELGDEDNARDAFHASVSLGSGEGGRPGAR